MEDSHDQYSSSVTHSLFGSQEYNKDYTFPILPNLKHLELTVEGDYKLSLSQLSSFMKASPYLQRLALKLRFWENPFNEGRKIKKAVKWPHHYIKVVEVFGYCDRTNVVEHVMFLMENVVALEKLVIVPYWSWDCHHSGSESGKRERKKEAKARRYLQPKLHLVKCRTRLKSCLLPRAPAPYPNLGHYVSAKKNTCAHEAIFHHLLQNQVNLIHTVRMLFELSFESGGIAPLDEKNFTI
ncbi:F-box family protein [Prunus dulcis]|uniref:F-box family protein n=1 Tax=Prunus dulcis TaxID=3755 RepID=A0A5H2XMA9_PRUDU|nr:F-box family protein [Prunus dulcis]